VGDFIVEVENPDFANFGANALDVAGWQVKENSVIVVLNLTIRFLVDENRDRCVIINGKAFGGPATEQTITQVLTANLEQGVTYTLTSDFGFRTDNSAPSGPQVLRLYAGTTLLEPETSSSPDLIKGRWVTHSRSYFVSNSTIQGTLKIEVGLGANVVPQQQLNIDHVTLKKKYC
jgi:hypothetical protein